MTVAIKKIMGIPRSAHQIADDPLMSDANLISYYKFEDNGNDSKGSNNLTVTNATYVAAQFNKGLNMDATGEYAEKSSGATGLPSGTGDFSFSFWAKRLGTISGLDGYPIVAIGSTSTFYAYVQNSVSDNTIQLTTYVVAASKSTAITLDATLGFYTFVCDTSGTKFHTYKNGVFVSTDTVTARSLGASERIRIGWPDTKNYNILLDEVAIWSKALTPTEIYRLYNGNIKKLMGKWIQSPTGVDDTYTKSLLHMNGVDASTTFTDESGKTWTARGGAQLDTAQKKFGTASGLFDGTGDYIDTEDSDDWNIGSGDFTVDCWIKRAATGARHGICGQCNNLGQDTSLSFFLEIGSDNKVTGGIYANTTGYVPVSTGTITDTNWHHIAMVRNGNTLTLYIDGSSNGTSNVTGATANNSTNKVSIGREGEYNGLYFNGWIDEFRFSKGIARWTADFTPPTMQYPLNEVKKFSGVSNV